MVIFLEQMVYGTLSVLPSYSLCRPDLQWLKPVLQEQRMQVILL